MAEVKPTALIILDGYGIGEPNDGNAVYLAKTPVMDALLARCPHPASPPPASTSASRPAKMGNSEVGHTNIGAGRVVFQDLPKISREVENGDFFKNPAYLKAMADAKESGGALHVLGLLSDGGVHSHITHIFALLDMAKREGLEARLRPLLPRRPRREPHLRRGLRREPPGKVRLSRQREDSDHTGPLLGHGPRQALGARAEGLQTPLSARRASWPPTPCRP